MNTIERIIFGKKGSYRRQFIHNAIVHPLMMLLPVKIAGDMHDKNANWAFNERVDELKYERGADVENNIISDYLLNDIQYGDFVKVYSNRESEQEMLKEIYRVGTPIEKRAISGGFGIKTEYLISVYLHNINVDKCVKVHFSSLETSTRGLVKYDVTKEELVDKGRRLC